MVDSLPTGSATYRQTDVWFPLPVSTYRQWLVRYALVFQGIIETGFACAWCFDLLQNNAICKHLYMCKHLYI